MEKVDYGCIQLLGRLSDIPMDHECLSASITHMVGMRVRNSKTLRPSPDKCFFPPSIQPSSGVGNHMDVTSSLERFAQRALRYCINLDGFVDRHEACVSRGGQARVYEGTLHPKGIRVAVKTIGFCPPESDAIIEVRSFSSCGSH